MGLKRAVSIALGLFWAGVLSVGIARCAPPPVRASTSPPPSQEHPSASEARATEQIEKLLAASVLKKYREHGPPAERDAHAKAQGCVKATFRIKKSLSRGLRLGVFARPQTFIAWIRFSNAVGTDDHAGLAHGMAIKLTGVPGTKILPTEKYATTQDFLLVNYPVFNVRDPADYVEFLKESQAGGLPVAFFKRHPDTARITAAIAAQRVGNPLDQRYFSMTPYLLGERYVKYSAKPIACTSGVGLHDAGTGPLPAGPNYLRKAMSDTLASRSACFTFMVQLQTDARTMPIEDSTVLWDEHHAPFVAVAEIAIPRQRFESPQERRFCENLSYTPWHALPVHRPVGNINRIRRVVYDAISRLRHQLNDVARKEPTGHEKFPGSPLL